MSDPLREAAQAFLDAEGEPAYSWVHESQRARSEGTPNREVERMERIRVARNALRAALALGLRDTLLADARATIEAMSGDSADLHDLIHEAAAMRTVLGHLLEPDGRIHDSGCGLCDTGRLIMAEQFFAQPDRTIEAALRAVTERCEALGYWWSLGFHDDYYWANAWPIDNVNEGVRVRNGPDLAAVLWDLLEQLPPAPEAEPT